MPGSPKTNLHWIIGPVALIDVSSPKYPRTLVMIDAADLPVVADGHGRWTAAKTNLSTRYASRGTHPRGRQVMHRHLMGAAPDQLIDHANGDGLDNRRRTNLRFATKAQNSWNARHQRHSAKLRGTKFDSRSGGSWSARIRANGRVHYLGQFLCEVDAGRAYDAAARELHGAFARLNFPRPGEAGAGRVTPIETRTAAAEPGEQPNQEAA